MAESPVVVLDIGASKVVCLVGEEHEDGELRLLGCGCSPCAGLQRSRVVDMPHLVEAIRAAVGEAESTSGLRITGAYAGLGGAEIRARSARSTVAVGGQSRPIDDNDVSRAMTAAEQAAPTEGEILLHRIVQRFAVDGQPVNRPERLYGSKLEVETLTVSAPRQACTMLQDAADQAGIEIVGFILESLAAAKAVISPDERGMGVGVLDIGAGSSGLAVFSDTVRQVADIPLGGDDISRDLSVVLSMTLRNAEQVKREYGGVCCPAEEGEETVTFQTTAGRSRTLTRQQLDEIIEARQREILEMVRDSVRSVDQGHRLAAGFVITGGGALLRRLPELGEEVLGMPVRIGVPQHVTGSDSMLDPQYATPIGLIRCALEQDMQDTVTTPVSRPAGGWTRRLSRLLGFV